MARILLAEDDEIMRITIQDHLQRQNFEVDAVVNGKEALEKLGSARYHLVISDVRMPEMGGLDLLAALRHQGSTTDVIMMTAYGSVDDAVHCLKEGASDYILKPFDLDDLIIRVNRILDNRLIEARCSSLEECCRQNGELLLGESPPMIDVFHLIRQIAHSDASVLITGESGTGKELAAAAIHRTSARAGRPYIRINCAAIPEGLMESELFGHERGAFTGAVKKKPGKFEMADGGTLLLDEIGDMPLGLQTKLLRVLQEGEVERVGGTRPVKVDVRILCATAKNLQDEVAAGCFRQDLLYRLSVIPLVMPPLRERKGDIPLLAAHFLQQFARKRRLPLRLGPDAVKCLSEYHFPGNVRELKNIIERASVLCPGEVISKTDLPADLWRLPFANGKNPEEEGSLLLSYIMASKEKETILRALTQTGGNRQAAADQLGISRKNLWQKMRMYGLMG